VDISDHTVVTNNFLYSLFSQCNITLYGVKITQASEHYQYGSYLGTLMTYGSDAAANLLSNAYFYLYTGDMQPNNPSAENVTAMTNKDCSFVGTGLARVGKYSYLVNYVVTYVTCRYTCCRASGCRSG